MAVTISSSLSTNISIDLSTSETIEDQTASATTSVDVGLTLEKTSEPPPVTDETAFLLIQTEATAVGEDTLALTDIDALVASGDCGSIVATDILLIAAATATAGELSYSDTSAAVETGYSSFMLIYSMETTQTASDGVSSISVSTSEINVLAVDGGASPTAGTTTTGSTSSSSEDSEAAVVTTGYDTDSGLEGNIAIGEIYAEAIGNDSLVDIAMDVLSIEDQLSMISTQIILVAA